MSYKINGILMWEWLCFTYRKERKSLESALKDNSDYGNKMEWKRSRTNVL